MKISGLSCETKKIFLVFLGHPSVHGQTLAAVWRLLPVPFGASCPLLHSCLVLTPCASAWLTSERLALIIE